MVKLFKDSFLDSSIRVLFLNLFLLPIYPDNVKPSMLGLFSFFSIIYFFKKDKLFYNYKLFFVFIVNSIPFLVVLLSMFYTSNFAYGKLLLLRLLPLFLIPLSFYLLKSNKKIYTNRCLFLGKLFYYSSTLFLFIVIFLYFLYKGYVTENYFLNYGYRIIFQLGRYSIHPIYASLYTSIALLFSISLFRVNKFKIYVLLGNIILIVHLLLLSRKSAIFLMTGIFLLYLFFNKKIKIKIKLIAFLSIFILGISVYNFVPDISNRFKDLVSFVKSNSNKSSSNLRINIYKTSIPLIKEKPYFGYGIGAGEDVLFQKENTINFFNSKNYNSHNQYLGYALNAGLFGLVFFLFFIFKNLKIAFQNSFEHASLIVFFILLMFVENILDRQNGILFFSLFINYFAFYAVLNEKQK